MKQKITLISAALAVLAILALILWPTAPNLGKYTDMYERGLYPEVSSALEKELNRHPFWHEARELLVKSALEEGRTDLALFHLAELEAAGWEIRLLERDMAAWLRENQPEAEQAEALINAARQGVTDRPAWVWVREFYLDMIIKAQRVEDLPGAVALILREPGLDFSGNMQDRLNEAWHLLRQSGDFSALWQVTDMLEQAFPDSHYTWRSSFLQTVDLPAAGELHREYPDNPLLAAVFARLMSSRHGLDFLIEWERQHEVDTDSLEYYANMKTSLVSTSPFVTPADLRYLSADALVRTAADSIRRPSKCRVILDWLEQQGWAAEEVKVLRQVLAGPSPILMVEGYAPSLSPDGRWLIWHEHDGSAVIRNLETGRERVFDVVIGMGNWLWSPDSSLVLYSAFAGSETRVYNTRGEVVPTPGLGDGNWYVSGWKDSSTLWVQELSALGVTLTPPQLWSLKTGTLEHAGFNDKTWGLAPLYPGPGGNLAWRLGYDITMVRGGETNKLTYTDMEICAWLPDGSGLLLKNSRGQLHVWTGGEPRDLGIEGTFCGWRNSVEFYWSTPVPGVGRDMLLSCNYKTGAQREYNILGLAVGAEGKTVVVQSGYETAVYFLP